MTEPMHTECITLTQANPFQIWGQYGGTFNPKYIQGNMFLQGSSRQFRGGSSGGDPPSRGGGNAPLPGNNPAQIGQTLTNVAMMMTNDGGSLQGNSPMVFASSHNKSKDFLKEFDLWHMANYNSRGMNSPYKQVVLALSYIQGPCVADWVRRQVRVLRKLVMHSYQPVVLMNEVLWRLFEKEFKLAFIDIEKEQNAHQQLLSLRMKGEDLDQYIAEFEWLCDTAGWEWNTKGTITQFQHSLKDGLHHAILEQS
jgi:Retrotransposon gag protein